MPRKHSPPCCKGKSESQQRARKETEQEQGKGVCILSVSLRPSSASSASQKGQLYCDTSISSWQRLSGLGQCASARGGDDELVLWPVRFSCAAVWSTDKGRAATPRKGHGLSFLAPARVARPVHPKQHLGGQGRRLGLSQLSRRNNSRSSASPPVPTPRLLLQATSPGERPGGFRARIAESSWDPSF